MRDTLPPAADSSAPVERPTRARHVVLVFCVVMAVLLYLDRMAINVALPAIAADLGLEITQVADSVAAFFWCYALFQVPGGWLGDRWGGRKSLALYVLAWSAAIAGLGLAGGWMTLVAMRALLGIGQAGAFATAASLLRRWIPFGSRGVANSAVSLGGRAGGVLAPALTALLMRVAATSGWQAAWRPVFCAYALLGLVWAAAYWRWFRDRPQIHSGVNAAERALISAGEIARAEDTAAVLPVPPLRMIRSRDLRWLALANFAVNLGWIFVGTLLPTFLITAHGRDPLDAGFAASLTAGAGMAGCLCGGVATDWLVRRFGLVVGRRVPGMLSYGGAAVTYAACYLYPQPETLVPLLILASFWGDFALGGMWATYQDIGGACAGTVLGWANMCGNIGAACAASLVPRLAASWGWPSVFAFSSLAYLVGASCWLAVDPRRRIVVGAAASGTPD